MPSSCSPDHAPTCGIEGLDCVRSESSQFQSEIITVIVGSDEEQTKFNVHKDVICAVSSFFDTCLRTNMAETSSKTVALPEDDPEAFKDVLKWAYAHGVTNGMVMNEPDICQWGVADYDLASTYFLADKLCMEAMTNDIMDAILFDTGKAGFAYCDGLQRVCDFPGSADSKLKEFLVEQLAYDLADGRVWENEAARDQLKAFLGSARPEAFRVIQLQGEIAKKRSRKEAIDIQPVERRYCHWHTHRTSPKCEPYGLKACQWKGSTVTVKFD